MKKVLITFLMLLLPVCDLAAYQVYLNNGSVISGVRSYDESDDEVTLHIGTGSLTVPKKDVLRIEGGEQPMEEKAKEGKDVKPEQKPEGLEAPPPAVAPAPTSEPGQSAQERAAKADELRTSLRSIDEEMRSTEQEEARLNAAINQKKSSPPSYDIDERRQVESEIATLSQSLNSILLKKADLVNRKAEIENELRTLGR